MERVVWRAIGELKEFPGNPRRHPEGQIARLMKSIRRFWTNPILVDETGIILAGHGRLEAARRLGMTKVPTITVSGLSSSEKRAVVIADPMAAILYVPTAGSPYPRFHASNHLRDQQVAPYGFDASHRQQNPLLVHGQRLR